MAAKLKKTEKSKAKKTETPKVTKKSHETNTELYWIIGVMASLIAVFLVSNTIIGSLDNFEYADLDFEKYRVSDNLDVLKTNILIGQPDGGILDFTLYLRNDPRKNTVPVYGEIEFPNQRAVFITLEEDGYQECEDGLIGIATLSTFIQASGLVPKSAFSSESLAEELDKDYVSCETHPQNVVIMLKNGEETKITKQGELGNCYVISINSCEVMPAIEKFEMQAIIDARNSANTGLL